MKSPFLTALLASTMLAACSGASQDAVTETSETAASSDPVDVSDLNAQAAGIGEQMAEQIAIIDAAEARIGELRAEMTALSSVMVDRGRACQTDADAAIFQADAPDHEPGDAAANAVYSAAFLDEVRGQACVVELPSGLMLRIRTAVESGASPVSGDMVTVHYLGQLPHGETFDSSYERGEPATFPSDRLISGWVEALPLMRVGETWELYIPSELAYGSRPRPGGPIGPDMALVFQLEMIDLP